MRQTIENGQEKMCSVSFFLKLLVLRLAGRKRMCKRKVTFIKIREITYTGTD